MEVRGPLKVHGRVEGDDPIVSTELATKNYVDVRFSNFYNDLGTGGGVSDHGALTGLLDNDHTQYARKADSQVTFDGTVAAEAFYLTGGGELFADENGDTFLRSSAGFLRVQAPVGGVNIDGALGGILVNNNIIHNAADPVAPQDVATKAYIDANLGLFYGVWFRETDGNPPGFRNDTVYFNSADFYISPNSVGKPVISFRGSSGGTGTALTVRDEDGTPTATNVSTIRFTNGTVTDNGGGDVSIAVTGGSGISQIDDAVRTYSSLTLLGFNSQQFYLTKSTTANKAVVNLRNESDTFQGHIVQPGVDNYFVVPSAQHNYIVDNAIVDCESGTATIGFYIVSNPRTLPGKYIEGMDNLSVSSYRQQFPSGSSSGHVNTMTPGNRLVLSIIATNGATHITYTVKLTKT